MAQNAKMENHNTDTLTSLTIIIITGLLKFLSHITPGVVTSTLTIISLTLTILYHAFGLWERFKTLKNANRKR